MSIYVGISEREQKHWPYNGRIRTYSNGKQNAVTIDQYSPNGGCIQYRIFNPTRSRNMRANLPRTIDPLRRCLFVDSPSFPSPLSPNLSYLRASFASLNLLSYA
jgi:hypothetical protein